MRSSCDNFFFLLHVFYFHGNLHTDVGEVRNKVYSILFFKTVFQFSDAATVTQRRERRYRIVPFANHPAGVGWVQVKVEDEWQGICDDTWDDLDATVFCKALGFKGSVERPRNTHLVPDVFVPEGLKMNAGKFCHFLHVVCFKNGSELLLLIIKLLNIANWYL